MFWTVEYSENRSTFRIDKYFSYGKSFTHEEENYYVKRDRLPSEKGTRESRGHDLCWASEWTALSHVSSWLQQKSICFSYFISLLSSENYHLECASSHHSNGLFRKFSLKTLENFRNEQSANEWPRVGNGWVLIILPGETCKNASNFPIFLKRESREKTLLSLKRIKHLKKRTFMQCQHNFRVACQWKPFNKSWMRGKKLAHTITEQGEWNHHLGENICCSEQKKSYVKDCGRCAHEHQLDWPSLLILVAVYIFISFFKWPIFLSLFRFFPRH